MAGDQRMKYRATLFAIFSKHSEWDNVIPLRRQITSIGTRPLNRKDLELFLQRCCEESNGILEMHIFSPTFNQDGSSAGFTWLACVYANSVEEQRRSEMFFEDCCQRVTDEFESFYDGVRVNINWTNLDD
jgi:hypothetical protein